MLFASRKVIQLNVRSGLVTKRCIVKARNQTRYVVQYRAWSFANQHYDGIRRFRRRDVIFFFEVIAESGPDGLDAERKLAIFNYFSKVVLDYSTFLKQMTTLQLFIILCKISDTIVIEQFVVSNHFYQIFLNFSPNCQIVYYTL